MSVAGDCLKVLMLLHTSSKAPESQRSLMSLLLEAIVMVLLASENDFSQVIKQQIPMSKKISSYFSSSFNMHFEKTGSERTKNRIHETRFSTCSESNFCSLFQRRVIINAFYTAPETSGD